MKTSTPQFMLGTGLSLALLFAVSCKNEIQPDVNATDGAARLSVSSASCAAPTSQQITLPAGLKDTDYNFIDQNAGATGTQINANVTLVNNARGVDVTTTNVSNGQNEVIGQFRGVPNTNTDGAYLTFALKNVIKVGSGIHVQLEVLTNSLSGYTGGNANKVAFKNNPAYQPGQLFILSLEFYDALGNPGGPYTGNNNLPDLRQMYIVSGDFSNTSWITLPTGLRDTDYSFVDQSTSIPGTQITPTVVLTTNRRLEVQVQGTSVSKPTVGLLGFYQKGGPDGAYLTFSISEVRKVGSGIQVVLNVVSNSLSNYSGTRTDKVAFKNDFPAGTKIVTSLEFYDAAGNPGNPNSDPAPVNGAYDNGNNVPKLRNMYEVGTCQPSPN